MSSQQEKGARSTSTATEVTGQAANSATDVVRARRRRNRVSSLSGIALIVVLAILWELSVRLAIIQSPNWPALSQVFVSFWELLRDGTFFTVFGPTLQRLALGYVAAALSGISIGLAMGYFAWIHRLLDPIVEILRPIPSPAYIPVAILFLGIGDIMKVFMIAFAAFFPILLNTVAGVRSVDPVLIDTGRTFGLGTRQVVRKVVFPSALVYIFTGLRISLAIALILTVIAEEVAGNSGIGFYLLNAQRSFLVPEMYASVVALAILGFALNRLFLLIESRVLSWNVGSQRPEIT